MKKVLTIAGSDCSGGAGIQADVKTMSALNVYGMSVITALTAQNTTGVYEIYEVTPEFVAKQLDCIFTDIRPDAIKIGMVSNEEIIRIIAEKLKEYDAEKIVIDPVMVSTSKSRLIKNKAVDSLVEVLLPIADVMTPNLMEAEVLAGIQIKSKEDMIRAAEQITRTLPDTNILIKGGHLQNHCDDLLYQNGIVSWFHQKKIQNPNTHGTGCTLSSAISSYLARGYSLKDSIQLSKDYLTGAIRDGLDLGMGSGPLNHSFLCKKES